MEIVHAPVPDLKGLLTESFERWAESGRSCALSGGATALIFLPALRAAKVNWSRITLFWADERAVDVDDPESNYGLADRMLLSPLGAKAPRAVRMPADLPLGQAALTYDAALEAELHGGALELALIGAGEDGHVCALFPGDLSAVEPGSAPAGRTPKTIAIENAPKMPRARLSLTMAFLLQTRQIWIIAVGPRKLPILQKALSKTDPSTPLDIVIQHARDLTVFTDQVIRRSARRPR